MAATVTPSSLSTAIQEALNRLRQLNTLDIQSQWQICQQDFELAHSPASKPNTTASWPTATLNDRQHIAWDRGLHVLWLYQAITVPSNLFGYPLTGLTLRLALTWWAEDAQIYVDGTLMQSGDLFECFTRLCLSEKVTPGQVFQIAIRLVSPGHDDGALVRSQLIYELPANHSTPEPSFVADELTVLATLEPDSQQAIEHAIAQLQWDTLTSQTEKDSTDPVLNLWQTLSTEQTFSPASTHPFQQSLSQLRRALKHLSPKLKARTVQCIGHAHLDMAWLWPIADTWEAAERTFNSILNLQKDFPELTYTHSSPALFEWLEHNRPELFKQIQQKVAEGSWSIDAGLWIEPEFNVISGEAIARQILYGQRYCQEKFGTLSTVAWLPDSFGFCWQLPQLLTQGGVQTFATLKLSWNDTTQFPHQLFWWQSPDGSRILSLMLPPIGTDIDPAKMSAHAAHWENGTGSIDNIWLPGLGDHGGGPTRDMLEKAQRWKASPFFPTLSFTSAQNYIDQLPVAELSSDIENEEQSVQSMAEGPNPLPVWDTDLYLELHRGCYTTHADQKRYNRRSEDLLYQAEVFATIAQITAHQPYPKAAMDTAWKKLLFNQFHDILPGTAIPEVFVDANRDWVEVKKIGDRILKESLDAIALTIPPPQPPHPDATPLLIFNALSWQRSAVVTLTITGSSTTQPSADWKIYDSKNVEVLHQKRDSTQSAAASSKLSFLAKNLPAVGYQCFWLCPGQAHKAPSTLTHHTLENEFLVATINPKTGQIDSLIEKSTRRETFRAPGNQLQAFQDKGQYWDAWN
ncbi:MAG: glycoside hydrolase family 38 C-terminal domain-containing protein, partial [Cyanobacteria bacterium J06560_2]